MGQSRRPFAGLRTEAANPRTRDLDRMSAGRILRAMNREDAGVAAAVRRVLGSLEQAVERVVAGLRQRGRLIFVGAGTSGRLGVLEAAECPPTFGTPPGLVRGIMAGGARAVFRSKEGAEDDRQAGAARMGRLRLGRADTVVGIAASGVTPFVLGALAAAGRSGASRVLVTCNPGVPGRRPSADIVIAPVVGPEVLAGSTRLKAGTATKLVLNMLTLTSMVRLGKCYGNRMVDLRPMSRKLTARAVRMVAEIVGVSERRAAGLLAKADGHARVAIVMGLAGVGAAEARARLRRHGGQVRPAILGNSLARGSSQ